MDSQKDEKFQSSARLLRPNLITSGQNTHCHSLHFDKNVIAFNSDGICLERNANRGHGVAGSVIECAKMQRTFDIKIVNNTLG